MELLNELSFERINLVNEYVTRNKELKFVLDDARLCISKAKTLNGILLTNIVQPETNELTSDVRVNVDDLNFRLVDRNHHKSAEKTSRKRNSDKEKDSNEESVKPIPDFRPFGILEPNVAKEGRRLMKKAVEIVLEIATLQSRIKFIDSKMAEFVRNSKEMDNISKIIALLEI